MKKTIITVSIGAALLIGSINIKAAEWVNNGYKGYSQHLYHNESRQSAHTLAQYFHAKRNCTKSANVPKCIKFIMDLNYSNQAEQNYNNSVHVAGRY